MKKGHWRRLTSYNFVYSKQREELRLWVILLACAAMPGHIGRFVRFLCQPVTAACLGMLLLPSAQVLAGPKVWIFNGDPGDELHHERYQKNIVSLRKSFADIYGIPANDVKVFYGPRGEGYDGICSRETLLEELRNINAATRDPAYSSVWVILQGHANSIPGGAVFNLPGPDVSAREMADALKDAAADKPLAIIATTAASDAFLKPLSAPGRFVITANSSGDPENEPDYPLALAAALADRSSDTDGDGILSVTELFRASHAKLEAMYAKAGYMIQEHPQLDGNGDGRATRRPALIDADPASKAGLHLGGQKADGPGFD